MKPETRQRVKEVMERWLAAQAPRLRRLNADNIRQGYPFHHLIFTVDEIMAARAERSIVTNMGNSLYPRLALEVARDRFNDVALEYTIEGDLNDAACNMIEQIVTQLREPRRRGTIRPKPDRDAELNNVLNSRGGGSSERSVKADLYIGDFPDGPAFIELKTPLPNLDIAAESKRKMLYFLAMMNRQGVDGASALLGLTYNPFVTRAAYRHGPTSQIMDMESEVLMGPELWDYIGGPGTYNELLEIIAEINPP